MITAALSDLNKNLAGFLSKAAEEEVLITKDGHPVGVLRGFSNDDDFEEYKLLSDRRFHEIVSKSREEYREGKFTRLEDIDK